MDRETGESVVGRDVWWRTKAAPDEMPDLASQTALFQSIREQTKAPAFQKFIDGSVAINDDGEPVMFYHGTTEKVDFDSFDTTLAGTSTRHPTALFGTFFSDNPSSAAIFAGEYQEWGADGRSIVSRYNPDARLVPVFLSVKNPFVFDSSLDFLDAGKVVFDADGVPIRLEGGGFKVESVDRATQIEGVRKFKEYLVSQGYDGIEVPADSQLFEFDGRTLVAFDPETQVKSAVGNNGQFAGRTILNQEVSVTARELSREFWWP